MSAQHSASEKRDLLIEIGTEELPPKALRGLSEAFTNGVVEGLKKAGFAVAAAQSFAAPRRLAVLIPELAMAQADREVERKGPSLKAAYDENGAPTRALQGFARSCGADIDQLETLETDKGSWLVYRKQEKGQPLTALIGDIVHAALAALPIPRRMRWGSGSAEFVRPVHWVVMLAGGDVIDASILDVATGRHSHGHRFHAPEPVAIDQAGNYARLLEEQGHVLADFARRRERIREQVLAAAAEGGGEAVIDDALLDEVTALNEWPVAVAGRFDEAFLEVPAEALIKTMQDNQKYFPVVDAEGRLKNAFITISNIDSRAPEKVRAGNERVVRPRLADARFFWQQDQKQPLEAFAPALEKVVFQEKLGTLADKVRRVTQLAESIATETGADVAMVKRAAQLSKCDLMTEMVGEFASLQGVMGRRYAEVAGEPEEVALALDEQYMPRGASDDTASTRSGQILSISDRIDTLVGIFAIGQQPTGAKDPYALRRASLGVLRTLIERRLDLDLRELLQRAATLLADRVEAGAVVEAVFDYVLERLRAYYLDRGVAIDVFEAVAALKPSRPLDFDRRIHAVAAFRQLPEAKSLAAANKRVGNILKKAGAAGGEVDPGLLREAEEKALFEALEQLAAETEALFAAADYTAALSRLAALREPVDAFFDAVMVMADDAAVRDNRLALLARMRALFMRVADLSRLHQA